MIPFGQYTPEHYRELTRTLDPIGTFEGYTVKRGDVFELGPLVGSKVRQCLHVVLNQVVLCPGVCLSCGAEYDGGVNLCINACVRNGKLDSCGGSVGGILTGAGLPSPQIPIVAGVARYFGLRCAVTTPRYADDKRDFNRINASLAQRFGADVYGVGNPNPSGYEKDAKELVKELGYFQIKFGMFGDVAMEPVIRQVENVPDYITDIVVVSGSGLSALSIMRGIARYKKNVERMHVVTLSGHFLTNKARWYDPLPDDEKFQGELHLIPSAHPYRKEVKWKNSFALDITYESKAFEWMAKNIPPSPNVMFWVIGRREYDLSLIEPIRWKMSAHERSLREPKKALFA